MFEVEIVQWQSVLVPVRNLEGCGKRETGKLPGRRKWRRKLHSLFGSIALTLLSLLLQPSSPPPVSRTLKSSDTARTRLHQAHNAWAAQQSQSTYQGKSCFSQLLSVWAAGKCNSVAQSCCLEETLLKETNTFLKKNKTKPKGHASLAPLVNHLSSLQATLLEESIMKSVDYSND